MADQYKIADTVQLKSGGPIMTVYEVAPNRLNYNCQWFTASKLAEGNFREEALQRPDAS
jgi:uncharacterized protein YodC (DUF2158 family)